MLHSGLKYQIKQLQRRHPDVDIILIEPRADDSMMFFANIMRLQDRVKIAEHGFRSVSVDLAGGYEVFKETLARYGIQISRNMVMADLAGMREAQHRPEVVQRILEGGGGEAPKKPAHAITGNFMDTLKRTLEMLEQQIDRVV